MAALRHLQPVAGGSSALRGDHDHREDGPRPLHMGDACAACWLVAVTFAASWHKVFDPNPLIGLLAHARQLAAGPAMEGLQRRIFNDQLDAAVCGLLVVLVSVIVIESATAVDQRDLRTAQAGNAGSAVCGDAYAEEAL